MALMTTSQMLTGIKNWVLGKIANITALIPLQASTSNQLADKAYVNSSVATATATFQGTYNVVSDFSLAYNATHGQIASALATKMAAISATPDNNDYAFVQIPTANATPTEIARIEKYKYNGSAWAFEYNLNNSGFTAAQWAAINSGATLELIGKLSALPTNAELTTLLGGKVDKVSGKGLSTNDYTTEEKNKLGALPTNDALNTALGTKQNVVQDLATIRSGASAGATAVQPTAMSAALVQTVAESGVFDLSAHNAVNGVLATYADLSAALAALNALTSEYKKPGMSFKFVCTYDNKYVQARCMAQNFTTDITQWQGMDKEPVTGSHNLVESGGVEKLLPAFTLIGNGSTIVDSSNFSVKAGNRYRLWINNTNLGINNTESVGSLRLSVRPFDASGNRIGSTDIVNVLIPKTYEPLANYYDFVTPDNTDYIVIKMRATVGDVLNCCIQDITIFGDVEQQFSEIDDTIRKVSDGQEIIQFTPNYGINLNLPIGSLISLTPISSKGRYDIVDVKEGDIAIISGNGGSITKTYGVVNAYNRLLLVVPDPSVVLDSVQVTMPATASKLIINSNGNCCLIRKNEALQPLQKLENDIEDILPTYDDPADYNFVIGQIDSSNGEIINSSPSIRVSNSKLINLKKGDYIEYNNPIGKMAIAVFSSAGVFETYLNFAQNIKKYVADKDLNVRVMFGYNNDSNTTPSELYSYLTISHEKIDKVNNVVQLASINNSVDLEKVMFERKAFDSTSHTAFNSNIRLLSQLIEVKAGTRITCSDYATAKIGIIIFDDNRKYSAYQNFIDTQNNDGYIFENDAYCEITFGYVNDRVIADTDEAKDYITIIVPNITSYVDIPSTDYIKRLFADDIITMHRRYIGKKQYRIHVDEVIYCLWRLATNNNGTANYQSVFDEPIFAEYKRIHDLYGTVFVLSLHYEQDSTIAWNAPIPPEMIGWSLEDMPNTWKDEFEANSDWLKFSYHTHSYSYRYIGNGYYNGGLSLDEDITLMEKEVFRFAGEDSWSCLYVKTHGVLGDRELIRIFQKHGAKYFEGDAEHVEIDDPAMQTYYLTDAQQSEMFKLGSYYDPVVNALFMAGAGNIDRIGFLAAGSMKSYLEDFSTIGYGLKSFLTCNYMSFCAHESPMMDGLGIHLDNVQAGDYITINGVRYTAGTDFAIGATDRETGINLLNALPNTINKFRSGGQYIIIYATLGAASDSFVIHTCFGQIEETAVWCSEHGFEAKHLEEGSFFDL